MSMCTCTFSQGALCSSTWRRTTTARGCRALWARRRVTKDRRPCGRCLRSTPMPWCCWMSSRRDTAMEFRSSSSRCWRRTAACQVCACVRVRVHRLVASEILASFDVFLLFAAAVFGLPPVACARIDGGLSIAENLSYLTLHSDLIGPYLCDMFACPRRQEGPDCERADDQRDVHHRLQLRARGC